MKKDWLPNKKKGVFYYTDPKVTFEELYLAVRKKEKRLHGDNFVKKLPDAPKDHPHALEWAKRKDTTSRFHRYLRNNEQQTILEIGCGNGWFANNISAYCEQVVGLDIGTKELEQATRCFGKNVDFVCCSDLSKLPDNQFDLIVFNGSIQYFDITNNFWKILFNKLNKEGEVHLLDSFFYMKKQADLAKERSEKYFSSLGVEGAGNYYNHVLWTDLPQNYTKLYTPNKLLLKLMKKKSPFPWVRIQKLS